MIAKVLSAALHGMSARLIEVEADIKQGLPGIQVIGMGDKAVNEARERVRSALRHSNLRLPARKCTISLAPADIRKDGAQFDLALAVSLLVASGSLKQHEVADCCFIGELSLDGTVKPTRGVIHTALLLRGTTSRLFIPAENAQQAALIDDCHIYAVHSLTEVYLHLKQEVLVSETNHVPTPLPKQKEFPLDAIIGQEQAKRALQIAVVGRHNILLCGPPGCGKTLLAQALPSLMPPLALQEQIEASAIHSLGKQQQMTQLVTQRPYRSPHHTVSVSALIGGGRFGKPGEISLAHTGVLHLDELLEFSRASLEALRQPLESSTITFSQGNDHVTYPADSIVVATTNPCPCGYFGDAQKKCICTEYERIRYQKRLSGPLLDRFDIVVIMNRVSQNERSRTHLLREMHQSYLIKKPKQHFDTKYRVQYVA